MMTPTMVTTEVDELGQALLQRGGDIVHVVGDAAQDLAVRSGVEELERQTGQLFVHIAAQSIDGTSARHRP